MRGPRRSCYACEWAAWDGETQRLWCRKNLPGVPDAGNLCQSFLRYAGAEE